MNHTIPAGITFIDWVQANGATRNGNAITWNIDTLTGGGMRAASFSASVNNDPLFWGMPITSTVTLAGAGGVNTSGEAAISVNGPTTPVTDSVTTRPNTPVSLWPLANDINPDGSPLTLAAVGAPAHGTATIAGDTVTYPLRRL
ncbi:MAG: hypothetical protein IPK16_04115 [Anaerolineales bacterium]|nr:hypothetical protein [Anaerolineales bacterium]